MGKVRTGIVISNKMDKTAIVRVDRMVPHKKYGKRFRVSQNFAAHDETNSVQIGDSVTIRETSPFSKTKNWEIVTGEMATKEAPHGAPAGEVKE
ncbi:MAG TPA: 30S ribosomal protein S17 [Patescibacteria group bacterium]